MNELGIISRIPSEILPEIPARISPNIPLEIPLRKAPEFTPTLLQNFAPGIHSEVPLGFLAFIPPKIPYMILLVII